MDNVGQGDSAGEKRQATLRGGPASLTATVCRVPFHRGGGQAGEGAR